MVLTISDRTADDWRDKPFRHVSGREVAINPNGVPVIIDILEQGDGDSE